MLGSNTSAIYLAVADGKIVRRTKEPTATSKERITKTGKIEPPKPKGESQGGTHASPRLHDRRGHWRNTRSGKRVWVKQCKVGDPSKGSVFHDYRFTQH